MHARHALALALVLATSAVAEPSTGSTTRTWSAGKPPWVRGDELALQEVAHAPVRVAIEDAGPALGRLAFDLDAALAGRPGLRPLSAPLPAKGGPSIYLGCELESEVIGNCNDETRAMVHAVTHPGKKWRQATQELLAAEGHVLILELTIADHWLTQRGLGGKKEVPLGAGRVQKAPWLTSLDTPVEVLQLTGMIVDARGKVVRSGVEGIAAVPTRFLESVAGLQRTITDEQVEEIRRDPGVRAALDALLANLLGR